MPGFNWRESQGRVGPPNHAIGGGAVAAEGHNWRTQLPPGSRHRIVNKLLDKLKKHLLVSGEEELQDLEETAVQYEESIFSASTSQSNYLRRTSLKIIGIELGSQNFGVNSLETNVAGASRNSQDPGMEHNDWRTELTSEPRKRIVNKIAETLKKHLTFSGLEGGLEVERIAVRFEERIYSSATSLSDYLRKISLKMLRMAARSYQFKAVNDSGNPQHSGDYYGINLPADDADIGLHLE